jgi:hypothetical protein
MNKDLTRYHAGYRLELDQTSRYSVPWQEHSDRPNGTMVDLSGKESVITSNPIDFCNIFEALVVVYVAGGTTHRHAIVSG